MTGPTVAGQRAADRLMRALDYRAADLVRCLLSTDSDR